MDQAANIHRIAAEMVRSRGSGACLYLRDNAEIAKLYGDMESAISWWDLALAALEIMKRAAGTRIGEKSTA